MKKSLIFERHCSLLIQVNRYSYEYRTIKIRGVGDLHGRPPTVLFMEETDLKLKYEYNGKLVTVIQKITGAIILSVLWLIFCIPVFTIGPSTRALFHTVDWVIGHDLGYPVKEFFKEFRKQFGKTIVISIPFLIIAALCVSNIYLINHSDRPLRLVMIMIGIWGVILLFDAVHAVYLFACASFFDADDKGTLLKNSYIMMITHPGRTFAMFGLFVLFVMVMRNFPFAIVVLPAILSFFHTLMMSKVFQEYTDPVLWQQREDLFKEERQKYEQQLDDRARELLHRDMRDLR